MPLKKLKEEEKASTEALLAAIEHKDRRFRLFQTLFMVGTFIALIFIIGGQQRTLEDVRAQQKQAEEIALQATEQSEDSDTKIIRRLNCMVVFFSERNRSSLSIDDIDRCTLNRDKNVNQFFQQSEETPAEQPPNLPDSVPSATSENDETQATVPEEPEVQPIEETPSVVNPRPPVAIETPIIDISLCLPLVDICVRQ